MYHRIEYCERCFTLISRGWLQTYKQKRKLKKDGHILFEQVNLGNGIYRLVFSTKQYKGVISI
jgi:hypothetical protein